MKNHYFNFAPWTFLFFAFSIQTKPIFSHFRGPLWHIFCFEKRAPMCCGTFVKELPTTICQLEIFTVIRISTLQGKPPNSSFLCNLKPMKIVILHVRRTPLYSSKLLRLHPCDYHSLNQTWVLVIINQQVLIDLKRNHQIRKKIS